uniref:Uncharacterized protein n=1 Tax=Arundo donax TaxID=35708 RepID=A0A0A9F8I9_ARUDO
MFYLKFIWQLLLVDVPNMWLLPQDTIFFQICCWTSQICGYLPKDTTLIKI